MKRIAAQWKSEEVAVLMTTNLTVEYHKCVVTNVPSHIQHLPVIPAKLFIFILNLGVRVFLIQWTNRNTRFYISTWFDTAVITSGRLGSETVNFIKGRKIS